MSENYYCQFCEQSVYKKRMIIHCNKQECKKNKKYYEKKKVRQLKYQISQLKKYNREFVVNNNDLPLLIHLLSSSNIQIL